MNFLDDGPVETGNYCVFDRGYLDFRRLLRIAQTGVRFVIRAKTNTRFYVSESRPVDKATGVRCDQSIRLTSKRLGATIPRNCAVSDATPRQPSPRWSF